MNYRYTREKAQVTAVLVIIIVVLSGVTYVWINSVSDEKAYDTLDFISATLVKPVSVDDAGWQIKLIVDNTGNRDTVLKNIYLNDRRVSENGLIHGEKISSVYTVASSLPDSGAFIQPGMSETIYLWIGSEAYLKGETLMIELQNPDRIDLKTIQLN